jgi:hypothetical protein
MTTIELTSPAFADGAAMPRRLTADGDDVSPPLAWAGVPPGTRSLALICDDPDAPVGTWVHWVLYGLPGDLAALPEAVPPAERLAGGGRQGLNDFGRVGYGGPAPPRGRGHRYVFTVYALDAAVDLEPRATKAALLQAMSGHTLGEGRLTGIYQRR